MPEGDTIFRTARTLHRALSGRVVTRFESVFSHLIRVDVDSPIAGRQLESIASHGKHLMMQFSGGLALRTHMRMNGSWHIYRPGERWQRPRHEMRIVIATAEFHAVAFNVPEAEFIAPGALERSEVARLGPDLLAEPFDLGEAVQRILARGAMEIADALLDQSAIAGLGNVYKSEVLFLGGVNPFAPVRVLSRETVSQLVAIAHRLMRANVVDGAAAATVTYSGLRRTTARLDPSARLWVYGRAGKPCRRCGTQIARKKQGPHARSTYWCGRCQPSAPVVSEEGV